MKLCELNLQELGDSPATHTPNRKRTRSLFHATVDGHLVDVYFERGFGLFNAVQIVYKVNGETEIPQHQKNKEGSPSKSTIKILSTVLDIIKQQLPTYIKKVRSRRVTFSADGASRIELYRKRMVPFMNELLGPLWTHEEESHGGKVYFTWVKKD